MARQYQRPVREVDAPLSPFRDAASAGSGRRLMAMTANIANTTKNRSKRETEIRISHPLITGHEEPPLGLSMLAGPSTMVTSLLASSGWKPIEQPLGSARKVKKGLTLFLPLDGTADRGHLLGG